MWPSSQKTIRRRIWVNLVALSHPHVQVVAPLLPVEVVDVYKQRSSKCAASGNCQLIPLNILVLIVVEKPSSVDHHASSSES